MMKLNLKYLKKKVLFKIKVCGQYHLEWESNRVSENSSIKLAQKDKYLKLQNEYELYSNQFIPLIVNADLLERIELQGKFDKLFSGGAKKNK